MPKRSSLFQALILFFVSMLISCGDSYKKCITSENGSITLHNYNFNSSIIPLDYQWEFYWNKLYTPEDFKKLKLSGSVFLKVPGVWNGFNTGDGIAGGDGFATYRFTVKNIPAGSYGLKISTMATAYKLWVNGKVISSNGTVAPGEHMIPQQLPAIALFDTLGEDVVITVQVSNYMSDKGGIWGSIYFGSADLILKERIKSIGIDLMLFGSFLIMSLYHFFLYAFRRKNRFTLYYGLFCFDTALRIIMTDEFYLVYMFPGINWNFEIRLEFMTMIAGFILLLMFIKELFSNEFSGRVAKFYQLTAFIYTMAVMLLPIKVSASYLPVFHLIILSGLIYIIYTLVRAVRNRREGSLFILTGCIVLILVAVNDMLDANNIIHTGYMFSYGLFMFIFSQSIIISGIFSRSFNKVEELSSELQASYNSIDEYNRNLESLIDERTRELSDANSRLRELDHAKTDFFANISHEFRTPLTLILAPIDEAISGKRLNRDTLETMYRNGRNLLSLINDLLDISRITAGRMILEVAETDISALVQQCCGEMESSAKLKNIELICNQDESKLNVYIDPERIAHVISNFFSNSFKFTDPGGRIEVSISVEGGYALITFSDTGCGIESDKMSIVFDRFFQADTSSKRRYEGTGIGLSIVKEFVELHGGTVSVESRHVDQYPDDHGTKFTVKLPLGRGHFNGNDHVVFAEGRRDYPVSMPHVRGIEPDPVQYGELTAAVSEDVPSILVVEDNADLRKLLIKMLRGRYTIFEASNGHEAIEILDKKEEIDLVLSDIMMPGMDGHELIRWIRADERFQGLPVVFLTARAESFMKIEGLDLGAIDYVTKPFNSDELILRIRNQMEQRTLRNSLNRNYEHILAKLRALKLRSVTSDSVSKIESICVFIKDNYMQDLHRDNLAAAVGLNSDTFSRLFNQHTGRTLVDYINELRINEAKRRLHETGDMITRICIDTGFENIRTFNRVFKKVTGLTPGEFRESGALKN